MTLVLTTKQYNIFSTVTVTLASQQTGYMLYTNLANWCSTPAWLFGCSRLADSSPGGASISVQSILPALYASAQLLFTFFAAMAVWSERMTALVTGRACGVKDKFRLGASAAPSAAFFALERVKCNILNLMSSVHVNEGRGGIYIIQCDNDF